MSADPNVRARLVAMLSAVLLVGGFLAATVPSASADEVGASKIWAGDDCPGGEWTCQEDGTIVQSSNGTRDLTAKCTFSECNITQTNTTKSNTIIVDQDDSQSSQDVSIGAITQTADQSATLDQDNGSGTNSILVTQDIALTANTNVQIPATQTQEGHQSVTIPEQTSDSGNQTISVAQNETLDGDANAPSVTQNQNKTPKIGQYVEIGSDTTVGMDTDAGANDVDVDQTQNFDQDAAGFGGSATLLTSVQEQGSLDEEFPAALLVWKVDSRKFNGSDVDAHQTKTWDQGTTPDQPPLGKTQNMFDELGTIGKLLTTDTSLVTQTATLTQDGSYRRCVQDGDVHNEINGSIHQNCNGTTQSASGEHYTAHLEVCEGTHPTDDCDESSTNVTNNTPPEQKDTTGAYGCGQGFWKEHTEAWPTQAGSSVQPGDLFGAHFTEAGVRFGSLAAMTMHQAISSQGGGSVLEEAAGNLARAAVAGLLNAEHDGVPYELHSKEVRAAVNDALDDGTRNEMLGLAKTLEGYNTGACPLA